MLWNVRLTNKAAKQLSKLPEEIRIRVGALMTDIRNRGPMVPEWKNFGKLRGLSECYHCHVKAGRPTYVVCWQITQREVRIIEVYYVGTHEKTPY